VEQNSRNSSRPPSSDSPFAKPAPKSLRRKSGKKQGGQSGHPGSTLAPVGLPDERVRHEPCGCHGCGADLRDAPEVGMEKRQVFDLPPLTVRVTEHQVIARRCACGAVTSGTAPEPFLFQRRYGSENRPINRSYIRECMVTTSGAAHITVSGQPREWRPHDFRRIFVTDALRSGLPPHIAAKICCHTRPGHHHGICRDLSRRCGFPPSGVHRPPPGRAAQRRIP
jgi:hypothetical protein